MAVLLAVRVSQKGTVREICDADYCDRLLRHSPTSGPPRPSRPRGVAQPLVSATTADPGERGAALHAQAGYAKGAGERPVTTDLPGTCQAIHDSGLPLRLGSWGDPAAVPFTVIEQLVNASSGHSTYTSQWLTCDQRLSRLAMASVLSPAERDEARDRGWRTFRIRTPEMPVLPREMICPASPEGGHRATCSECLACGGTSTGKKKDLVITAHGSTGEVRKLCRLLRARYRRAA